MLEAIKFGSTIKKLLLKSLLPLDQGFGPKGFGPHVATPLCK